MFRSCRWVFGLLVPMHFFAAGALAFSGAPSFQGFTGLINTPNALVTPSSRVDLLYSNQIDPMWRHGARKSDNYTASFGLLPSLEVSSRLAWTPGFANDLSANLKWQVPGIPAKLPRVAFGVQDIFGGVPHFRTQYAVATQEFFDRVRFSVGYGLGPDRMEGLFGGAELRVADWLHFVADHDADEAAVAVRMSTPPDLLPWGVSAGAMGKTSLEEEEGEWEFAVFLSTTLGRDDRAALCPPTALSESSAPTISTSAKSLGPVPAPEASLAERLSALTPLHQRLLDLGFENLRVGRRGAGHLWVELENSRYNHNELDGIGLALGTALELAPADYERFTVRLLNEGLPVADLRGPIAPFRDVIRSAQRCLAESTVQSLRPLIEMTTLPPRRRPVDVVLLAADSRPKRLRSTLLFYPDLSTAVGTELGIFDYRLGLKADLFLHLWKGATFRVSGETPLAWSDDYADGGFFNRDGDGTETKVERILFNQAFSVAPGVLSSFSAGQFRKDVEGIIHETLWSPGEGTHRLRLNLGAVDGAGGSGADLSALASYRYHYAPLDLYAEATVGQFVAEDRGYRLEMKRFFGNTAIGFFYLDTDDRVGGIQMSLPLTPRRDMRPAPVQVRGAERWEYTLQTVLADRGDRNPLRFDVGIQPETEDTLERRYLNSDRLSQNYLRAHLPRLFEAYWTWGRDVARP